MNENTFRSQIEEDIRALQEMYGRYEPLLNDPAYAFNLWVLVNIYNLDEEIAISNITENNDKSIDCYAYYEDAKKLYLIQNKYYNETSNIARRDVTDFLETPLTILESGDYKNKDLQNIFNELKKYREYEIWLHFYVTNNKNNKDVEKIIKKFNLEAQNKDINVRARIFFLDDIYRIYYFEEGFKENQKFSFILETENKGTVLQIKPKDYNLPTMIETYYIMTPVVNFYKMILSANKKKYMLFEENVREYLGPNSINKKIIDTLEDKEERKNFFYYNNGITIICEKAQKKGTNKYKLEILNPQIINGCQTVNSIYEVLKEYSEEEINVEFKDVYVIAKVLVVDTESVENEWKEFYKNVVKYTNSQNSINESVFGSKKGYFINLQNKIKKRGFLLLVKQSDKNKFKEQYKSKIEKNKILEISKRFEKKSLIELKGISDIQIKLDKLLQVYLAFIKDGYYAYTRKNEVLRPDSDIYKNYSLSIKEKLTVDNLIYLYLLYKRADKERRKSADKKTPIPYYLIGFLGYLIRKYVGEENYNQTLQSLFNDENKVSVLYNILKKLTEQYRNKMNKEYNSLIKTKIDYNILDEIINEFNYYSDGNIDNLFKNIT